MIEEAAVRIQPSVNATALNPGKVKRLKTLMSLMAKSKWLQTVPVQVVHHYTYRQHGSDFTFESLDGGQRGHMSGRGGMVRCGDHIILHHGSELTRYQVDEINYDAAASNRWIALLRPCTDAVDRASREPVKAPTVLSTAVR